MLRDDDGNYNFKKGEIIEGLTVYVGQTSGVGWYDFRIWNENTSGPDMEWEAWENSPNCSLKHAKGNTAPGGGSKNTVYLGGTNGQHYNVKIWVEDTTPGGNGTVKYFWIDWTKG